MEKKKSTANKEEIEKLILDLGESGLTSEKIGQVLKNEHKIYTKQLKIKISEILKKNDLFKDADIENLRKKAEKLKKHLEKNKHDYKTKRILLIKEAKLKKLEKIQKIIKNKKGEECKKQLKTL